MALYSNINSRSPRKYQTDGVKKTGYTVKKGDSLSRIAAAHNITVEELIKLNVDTLGYKSTTIHPGNVLKTSAKVAETETPGYFSRAANYVKDALTTPIKDTKLGELGENIFNEIVPLNLRQYAADITGIGDLDITESDLSGREQSATGRAIQKQIDATGNVNSGTVGYDHDVTGEGGLPNADLGNDAAKDTSKGLKSVFRGFVDSDYSMQTTLGQANYKLMPDGTYSINDTYNFNDANTDEGGQGFSGVWDDFYNAPEGTRWNPYNRARSFGRHFGSGEGEGGNVNISGITLPEAEEPNTQLAQKKTGGVLSPRKFQSDGLGVTSGYGNTMYGENALPGSQDTSSMVYQQSQPLYQKQLNESLEGLRTSTQYTEDAQADTASRERRENIATTVGKKGLDLGVDKLGVEIPDQFKEASMLSNFKSGVQGYKVATGAKGAADVLQNSKGAAELLGHLSNYGSKAKTFGGGIAAGVKGVAQGMGPGGVGAVVNLAGKGVTNLADDDDATTLTGGEAVGSGLQGAGTGLGIAGLGAGLGTALGVGAANAWNPFGWLTMGIAATAAGGKVLKDKWDANKAGDDIDAAEDRRDSDMQTLYANKRADQMKDRTYSGYDFGQDQNQGFYGKTGGVKYQSEGFKTMPLFGSDTVEPELDRFGYPITNAPLYGGNVNVSDGTDTSLSTVRGLPQANVDIIPESESNVTPYQTNEERLAEVQNGGTTNAEAQASPDAADKIRRLKIDQERGYSIQTMKDGTTTRVPITTHPTEGQMNLADAQNQGVNPNAAWMYGTTGIGGDANAISKYVQENPNTNPEAINMYGTIAAMPGMIGGATSAAPITGAIPGNAVRAGVNSLINPTLSRGKLAWNNFKGIAGPGKSLTQRVLSGLKGTYNAQWAAGIPGAQLAVGNQVVKELSGMGNDKNRTAAAKSALTGTPALSTVYDAGNAGISAYKGDNTGTALHAGAALTNKFPLLQYGIKNANVLKDYFKGSGTDISLSPTVQREGGVKNLPGGKVVDIGNGAKKYIGQTHAQGGIMADPQSEIENNEVEKDVMLKGGTMNPYIFSEYLKTDGTKNYNNNKESVANVAEDLAVNGAPQSEFDRLAKEQEKLAGRSGDKIMDTTMAKYGGHRNAPTNYRAGGVTKYQSIGTSSLPAVSYLNSNYVAPDLSLDLSNFPSVVPASTSSSTSSNGYTSPFEVEADERAFQDWINSKGGNTGGYGWGKDSAKAWADYGGRYNEFLAGPSINMESLPIPSNDFPEQTIVPMSDEDQAALQAAKGANVPNTSNKNGLTKKEERALAAMKRDIPLAAYAAGAAQLAPAMYAFLHKEKTQKLLNAPARLRAPHLDRVNYNTERSRNTSDNKALNRYLDTSGGGPATLIGKMAAYRQKQKGDMEITAAETRMNSNIANQEAQMKIQVDDKNAANQLRVGMVNTQMMEQQRIAEENTRKESIDVAVNNLAGMTGDALTYKGQAKLSRAIGTEGIHERNRLREHFRRSTNPRTGELYTDKEITVIFNTTKATGETD